MVMGAPPKYHTLEQVHELGRELLDYIDKRNAEGDPILHLCEWYHDVKNMKELEWKSLCGRENFVEYFEPARRKIALSMMRNKDLPQSYGNRFIPMYMSELRQFERQCKKEEFADELELRSKSSETATEEEVALNKAIVQGISKLQELRGK